MTATAAVRNDARAAWSAKNKIGLGLAIFYAGVNIPSVALPTPEGGNGPPMAILVICSILGVVALVSAVIAWRQRSRPAARLAAGSLIVVTLTSLPAFFVDVPTGIKVLVSISVLLAIAIVVLIFSPPKQS